MSDSPAAALGALHVASPLPHELPLRTLRRFVQMPCREAAAALDDASQGVLMGTPA